MDRLWRSNSSVSSRTGCPPNIVNEEDHNVENNELFPDFQKWNIPKVDAKTVYKTSFIESTFYSVCPSDSDFPSIENPVYQTSFVESAFHSAHKARTVEQI